MSFGLASLSDQQNLLLAQIACAQVDAPSRGLSAYRANAQANARRALEVTYPIIAQMVGEENFAYLARDFLHHFPPQRGDLAQWGGQLASFLAEAPQLENMPFLTDVARIEWALHLCASAQDKAQNLASFSALAVHEPGSLWLDLAPGAYVLNSAYPAAAMALAHQGQLDQAALDAAFDLLGRGVGQTALVWREGFAPRLRVLHADEQSFTHAVHAGQHLGDALECASADFDFSAWLSTHVQNGLVLGIV